MKAFFSRKVPFYLISAEAMTDDQSFDAYEVEVDEAAVAAAATLRAIPAIMEAAFANNAAPEEAAQEEADLLSAVIAGDI